MGKLINRIPGSRLLISSLPGSALRRMLNHSASLAMSTCVLKALPGKLDIKRHSPSILYLSVDLRYFEFGTSLGIYVNDLYFIVKMTFIQTHSQIFEMSFVAEANL